MYCVIDIGSNSVRLVVYRLNGNEIVKILNSKHTVGLASYIEKKELTDEGIERLVDVLNEFKDVYSLLPGCRVYPFATASIRNVENTDKVLEEIYKKTGMKVRVLSGEEEAIMDYRGAVRSIPDKDGLVVDIGGGSTELVFCSERKAVGAYSMPIGSLNLYSRFVEGIIPDKKEIEDISKEITETLEKTVPEKYKSENWTICGVGGTARGALKLFNTTSKAPENTREYGVDFLDDTIENISESPKKLVKRILKITPERIHTILPGMMILDTVAKTYGSKRIITSPYGVREGYLSYILEEEGLIRG